MTTTSGIPYRDFWSRYLAQVQRRHPEWRGVGRPTDDDYLYQSSGFGSGVRFGPCFKRDGRVGHELVLMDPDGDLNLQVYGALRVHREEFEQVYGRLLTWDPRRGRKRCLIAEYGAGHLTIEPSMATTDEYVEWLIDCGIRLRHTLSEFAWVIEALT